MPGREKTQKQFNLSNHLTFLNNSKVSFFFENPHKQNYNEGMGVKATNVKGLDHCARGPKSCLKSRTVFEIFLVLYFTTFWTYVLFEQLTLDPNGIFLWHNQMQCVSNRVSLTIFDIFSFIII